MTYYWRLHDNARGRSMRRRLSRLREVAADEPAVDAYFFDLAALLMIETTERPLAMRILERLAGIAWGGITMGPFQMHSAPLRFRASVIRAAHCLHLAFPQGVGSDRDLARVWNGAASTQPGSSIGYAEALAVARQVYRDVVRAETF